MSTAPPISITGLGAVCGSGLKPDEIWQAVVDGRSSIGPIVSWDTTQWPVHTAAEVQGVDNRTLVEDRKLHKMISRTDLFGLYAAGSAIQDSGLLPWRDSLSPEAAAQFNDRSGVFAGSGGGNYKSNYDFFPALSTAQGSLPSFGREFSNSVNPMWLLRNLPNNVLCHVGIRHGFKGTNACVTNQCVGGVMAVAEAAASLRGGEADRAVAVGHDAPLEPETVLYYHRLGLMAADGLKPFDADRNGTIFGEGAAAIMLEAADHARARKAEVLGEFLGSGCVTEGVGVLDVRPDGDGVRRAIELALADAQISPRDIGMIVAHGNGTPGSDVSEAAGIRAVFGTAPPPITGFKWAFGHTIAASGVMDLALGLISLRRGVVPGIASLENLDPALAGLPISNAAQKPRSQIALVLSRGFAAMNVALLIRAVSSNGP
jgi:3-oxoacyl-[acyl-carrier-protein] synthase-1